MQGAKTVLPVSKLPGGRAATGHRRRTSGMAKSCRLRTARQEHQPWHASTAAQEMPVMSKVEQMQATPARGEPDKLAIEARKTGFDEIYLPFRADQAQGSPALP